MKFQQVTIWSWRHYFLGQNSIQTKNDVTEQQVRNWIDKTSPHSGGNWDQTSLTKSVKKVKASKVQLIEV